MDTRNQTPLIRLDVTAADIHGEIRRLRETGPVVRVALPDGIPAWVITSHRLLQDLLTDPRVAKDARHWAALAEGQVPKSWPLLDVVTNAGMTTSDGADHRRLRGLVSQAFTPRRIAALRPRTEERVHRLLDGLAAQPPGPVDLRRHFAYPLPMATIGDLLGVAAEHHDEFHDLSAALMSSTTTADEVLTTRRDLHALLADLVAAKREHPGEDLTTDLIRARQDEDRLSEDELIGTLRLMLIAGHGTTMNLITNSVRALLTHPGQLSRVLAGERPWTDVIEESLRWDSPVAHFPLRYATADIPLGGAVIRRGDAILASYAAAGRDPEQHGETADEFDIDRPAARHLAFGHGPHYCLGAPLSRQEAEIALPALFARFPGLRPAVPVEELEPLPSFIANSTTTLPVWRG